MSNICSSCGKGCQSFPTRPSNVLLVRDSLWEDEITYKAFWEGKLGKYVFQEFGVAGLNLKSLATTALWTHIPPKSKKTKEERLRYKGCLDWSVAKIVELAKGKMVVCLMGVQVNKIFTKYNISDVYGLSLKSDLLPNVPVVLPMPDPKNLLNVPIGEMRLAIKRLKENLEAYEQYKNLNAGDD